MWKIKELKSQAKKYFYKNYWQCVLASFLFAAMTYVDIGSIVFGFRKIAAQDFSAADFAGTQGVSAAGIISAFLGTALLVNIAIHVLVRNPIKVGYARFLLNCDGTVKCGDMFLFLNGIYISSGWKMFCTDFLTGLWSILLIFPGVIKAYAWRMVPYVLAENPMLSGSEARKISAELMQGHKWHSFKMDLSFIGWYILSAISYGVAGIFYGNAFANMTECELYKTLRK